MEISELTSKQLTRKDFLSMIGGALAGAALLKLTTSKEVISTVLARTTSSHDGYGNSVYGGKKS